MADPKLDMCFISTAEMLQERLALKKQRDLPTSHREHSLTREDESLNLRAEVAHSVASHTFIAPKSSVRGNSLSLPSPDFNSTAWNSRVSDAVYGRRTQQYNTIPA